MGESRGRRAVAGLVAGILVLAAAFGVLAYNLNPASLRIDALRFLAIALAGILAIKGVRGSRLLLLVLTGLAAAFAVLTALSVRMGPLWKGAFLLYGIGTLVCLAGLFLQPARTHFAPPDRR